MDAIISAKDLVFSYPGDARLALDHVSLTVGKGDLVAVSYTHLDVYKRQCHRNLPCAQRVGFDAAPRGADWT